MLLRTDVQLPGGLGESVRQQTALTFRAPYETPVTVAVNAR